MDIEAAKAMQANVVLQSRVTQLEREKEELYATIATLRRALNAALGHKSPAQLQEEALTSPWPNYKG